MKTDCSIIGKGAPEPRYEGFTGVIGTTGIQGLTGIIGTTGIQGSYTGFAGPTGIYGSTGIQGYTGFQEDYQTTNSPVENFVLRRVQNLTSNHRMPYLAACLVGGFTPIKKLSNFLKKYWEAIWAIFEKRNYKLDRNLF